MKGHDEIFMYLLSRKNPEKASVFSNQIPKRRVDNLLVTSLCDFAGWLGGTKVAGTAILDALEQAIGTRNSAVSGRVLLRLVALHESLSEQQNTVQDIDFDGFFVKLLAASDRGTRMGLAQHWCGQKNPPKQALILLALDPDPSVATFVINSSKSLTENDLLQIAQRGTPTQWHALADRVDLTAIIVDFLMIFADSETRKRIKTNPFAHWSPPAENLFNRQKNLSVESENRVFSEIEPRQIDEKTPEKTLFPERLFPRRDALVLATRLALHTLDRPAPHAGLLPALLTNDLAQNHHARLLARLALAANLSAEAVVRSYTAKDARYFATILWALDIPKLLFDRLFGIKQQAFPLHTSENPAFLLEKPLTPEQARQALVFFSRADQRAQPTPAVWP